MRFNFKTYLMRTLLLSLTAFCILAGCKKDDNDPSNKNNYCPVKCTVVGMYVSFGDAFSWDDLDTVNVRRYASGSSFSKIEDSTTYTLADTTTSMANSTTLIRTFKGLRLYAGTDYEIIIPATGQTFHVYDIIEPEEYKNFGCDGRARPCEIATSEFSISGGLYHTAQYYYYPIYLWLDK